MNLNASCEALAEIVHEAVLQIPAIGSNIGTTISISVKNHLDTQEELCFFQFLIEATRVSTILAFQVRIRESVKSFGKLTQVNFPFD